LTTISSLNFKTARQKQPLLLPVNKLAFTLHSTTSHYVESLEAGTIPASDDPDNSRTSRGRTLLRGLRAELPKAEQIFVNKHTGFGSDFDNKNNILHTWMHH